jgi:hypothetical protein
VAGSQSPFRSAAQPPSLLELPSKLGRREEGHWQLSVYPEAAEAGGCFVSAARPSGGGGGGLGGYFESVEEKNDGRARGKIRRYGAANRLNRLGTLTYAGEGCHDPSVVRDHLAKFFRSLRQAVGVKRFAYLWTDEWHPGGHGLHAHFAVGRFIPRSALERSWPHGFVHIKLIGDLPTGSGALEEARRAALYLGKYAAKHAESRRGGLHRYEVGQGFQPRQIRLTGRSDTEVIAKGTDLMGREPVLVRRSSQKEKWAGPPTVWLMWSK